MATETKTPARRYRLEAFRGVKTGVSTKNAPDLWWVRVCTGTGKRGDSRDKWAVTESYVGGKSKAKLRAQAFVNGTGIPVIRLDIMATTDAKTPIESWVLRPGQKAQKIDIKDKTPKE